MTTLFRFGAMRLTVPEPSFETQTAPAPKASAYGAEPTAIRFNTRFVAGPTRVTRPPFFEPTQTLPAPYASPKGLLGMPSRQLTRPATGSTRISLLSTRSVTHRAPPPGRAKEADSPTCSLVGWAAPAVPHTTATATTTTPPRSRLTTILRYFTTRLR